MSSQSEPLPRRLFPLPEGLVTSPLSVLCLALLANALCQPYLGVFHDARLYAFALESRLEPGMGFDQDLYLVYGSQDRYSLFNLFMFPVVKLLGLDAGIFVVYLLAKALFFWSCQRLVQALTHDDRVTAVIVLLIAVVSIPFGGNEVFHVNEAFLTPRLVACALVLLGLERMLAGKILLPAGLLLGALAMHPLMGAGGILTLLLWWSFGRLTWWQLTGLGAGAVGVSAAVLAYEPLGTRLLGHMDEAWHNTTLQVCFFVKPSDWMLEDWARMAWDGVIVVVGAFTFARHCTRFLWAVLAAGLIGLGWTVVGVQTHYLLLIQTSPYRTLWVLEFLAVPLGIMAVSALWKRGTPLARCGSLALLFFVGNEWLFDAKTVLFVLLVGGAVLIGLLWHRGLGRTPVKPDWLSVLARHTFVAGCGLQVAFAALILANVFFGPQSEEVPTHPAMLLRILGLVNSRLVCFLVVCQAAGFAVTVLGYARRFQFGLATTAVAYLAMLTYLQVAPWYQMRYVPEERQTEFVAAFLREQRDGSGRAPCVYWNVDIYQIWFRLRATSYVTIYQMAGCAFNRETAYEGKRRVHLVALFENDAERNSPKPLPARWRQFFMDFRDCPTDAPAPTRDDLFRLAREEQLDYAILPIAIDDLYCKTDGHVYIYDCKQLRALAEANPTSSSVAHKNP
jgi:hypothetical protein